MREGAYLRNFELDRFMGKYHPLGERAPRDVVARAIVHEMEVSRAKDPFVYLDLTHMNAAKVQKRFPRIYETCMAHNIDITEDVIPVRPAAHYCVGGVRTDLDGKTNVAGPVRGGRSGRDRRARRQPLAQQFPAGRPGVRCARGQGDGEAREDRVRPRRAQSRRPPIPTDPWTPGSKS